MKLKKVNHESDQLFHLHFFNDHFSAKIYPNLGGSLQELKINSQQVIDGISPDISGLEDYKSTYKSSVLFPFPNRIEDGRYEFEDQNYELNINEKTLNNAIHGLVYDKSFKVGNTELEEAHATAELCYESDGSLKGFPFEFELKIKYRFHVSGNVAISFTVTNTGKRKFPYGIGWHPYFRVSEMNSTRLEFPALNHFKVNERMLPLIQKKSDLESSFIIGSQQFDDAFILKKGICELENSSYRLLMEFDAEEEAYFQIYTPEHRKNVALEPMTCVANSFNSEIGLRVLQAQQKIIWNIALNISTY